MNGQDKIYQMITDQIITKLEAGTVPWHKPWKMKGGGEWPRNLVSNRPYRGINVLLTSMQGFNSPYWLSKKQCLKLGGRIKYEEFKNGTTIVFWKWYEKEVKVDIGNGIQETETQRHAMMRYYRVYNVEQCEGLSHKRLAEWEAKQAELGDKELSDHAKIESCVQLWEGYKGRPELKHAPNRAFYRPADDFISIPESKDFDGAEEYYNTLFHEAVHSTGHESRLGRPGIMEFDFFGSHKYSKEELVAEMGAAFMAAIAGIDVKVIDNSAAYIQSWLKELKNDHKLITQASQQAQKAVDHITGYEYEETKS